MRRNTRLLVLLVAVLLLGAVGTGAVRYAADHQDGRRPASGLPVRTGTVSLTPGGHRLLVRNMAWGPHRDEIAELPADAPDAARTVSGVKCLRFHTAGGLGSCLQAVHGALSDSYRAVLLDQHLHELHHFDLAGIPSRTRVSPSGHLAAWTVFVGGDSYAGTNFSTRTSIVDTRNWRLDDTLESYAIVKDGHPYHSGDINVWGVTFADDDRFYATVATAGQTYLAQGSVTARTLTTLHQNVECPSLSPDGTRIAYKKRVPGAPADAPWRLYVLDLHTMTETATAEQRNLDDQALWADTSTLVYALPSGSGTDLWTVPADGSGTTRRLMTAALAPAYL